MHSSYWYWKNKQPKPESVKELDRARSRATYLKRGKTCNYDKDEYRQLGDVYRYQTYHRLKSKAKRKRIPFDLELGDFVIPSHCPVLGIKLEASPSSSPHDASPSIDRVNPKKGYVKGNVIVVSAKANRIKSDATIEELKRVVEYYTLLLCE